MLDKRPDGKMILLIGVSRSGKSVYLKEILEHTELADRQIAFDPKGEYVNQMGFVGCYSKSELLAAAANHKGSGKIAFVATGKKNFDFFCDVAFNWNRQARCAIVCEELADVTNQGKADGAWGRLVNQSLAFGPLIVGTVQRGQEVDKSVMNNASYLHISRHNTDDDAEYIAGKLGLDVGVIPREKLQFVQWTSDKGLVTQGSIDFAGAKRPQWPDGSPRFRSKTGNKRLLRLGKDAQFKQLTYS